MEYSSSTILSIPGWIWVVTALAVIGVTVIFILHYQSDDQTRSDNGVRSRHRHRRHRRRQRGAESGQNRHGHRGDAGE